MRSSPRSVPVIALFVAGCAPMGAGAANAAPPGSYLAVDGSRIYYEEAGAAGTPTVILLHGGLLHSIT